MAYNYCIRKRKKGTHLTFAERLILERIIMNNAKAAKKDKLSMRMIAKILGVSASTISRELKRGCYERLSSDYIYIPSYSADIGQNDYDRKAAAKGPNLKIASNHSLESVLEMEIIDNKRSPFSALQIIKDTACYKETPICLRTLYNYINMGLFFNISKKDCPRKGKSSRRKYKKVVRKKRDIEAKSIKERPIEATMRSELGHWEMDCIESGRHKGRTCLLTMIDRTSRQCLIFKMPSQTQKSVLNIFDSLEKEMGIECFTKVFKSITVDNGSEFLDWRSIETSINPDYREKRTQIYFCDSYSSWQRGSNEQLNGQIRRFIKKGSAISDYSKQQIKSLVIWLNTNPRKILNGFSPNQYLKNIMKNEGAFPPPHGEEGTNRMYLLFGDKSVAL
ncbi:MAG: IS30 family transposase [Christensenellales bacterium]